MKKYIKIKAVMAEPMTMAEANKHYFIIDWGGFLESEAADADGYRY